jgi:sugar/nucleoside kinase (ribokinase family)
VLGAALGTAVEASGGSCANTVAAAASFGADVAFIGKVSDDKLGKSFIRDVRTAGVRFETVPLSEPPATARCLVMVSPDGQRTMSTYLGACVELGPEDIDTDLVGQAKVTYLEGYLWDPPRAKEAFRTAMAAAHDRGRQVALTLSDTFCVERHREEFRALVENDVDILFANDDEMRALYQTEQLEDALKQVRGRCSVLAVTRAEKGSVVRLTARSMKFRQCQSTMSSIPPAPVIPTQPGSFTGSPADSTYPCVHSLGRSRLRKLSRTSVPARR